MNLHGITSILLFVLCSFTKHVLSTDPQYGYAGSNFTFICIVKNVRIDTLLSNVVYFKKENKEIATYTKVTDGLNDKFSVQYESIPEPNPGSTGLDLSMTLKLTLKLKNAEASDGGVYDCVQNKTKLYSYEIIIEPEPAPVQHVSFTLHSSPESKVQVREELEYTTDLGEVVPRKELKIRSGNYVVACVAHGGVPEATVSVFKGQEEIHLGTTPFEIRLTDSVVDLHCKTMQSPRARPHIVRQLTFATTVVSDKAEVLCSNSSAVEGASFSSVTCQVTAKFANCQRISWLVGKEKHHIKSANEVENYRVECQRDSTNVDTYITKLHISNVDAEEFENIYNIVVENSFGETFQSAVTLRQNYVDPENGASKLIAFSLPVLMMLLSFIL